MHRHAHVALPAAASLLLAACSGSGGAGPAPEGARLVVTASTTKLEPSPAPYTFDPAVVAAERVDAYYLLTTPAGTPLQFELGAWADGARGTTTVALDHVEDDGAVPRNDPFSLIRAGLAATGTGLTTNGEWIAATGDGLVRLTVHGRIERPQRLVVRGEGTGVTIVDLRIGDASEINRRPGTEPEASGVLSRTTIYSSDSWQFGLPTIAVSGDRTSIVCYEGDRQVPNTERRYELRMQHDAQTGAVTGGATVSTSLDTGNWRDHEIVALYNVLGVVRSEAEGVNVRLSFDRGATFAQEAQVLPGSTSSRLVQAAMAGDYSVAIGAWCTRDDGSVMDFALVEGRPVAFDASGSPTWFQFQAPQILHTVPAHAMPLISGITWSEGGDLVVGYGTITFGRIKARCAVRKYGEQFVDALVAEEIVFAWDPSVAVSGQGASLRVFYAYESRAGITLAVSDDGGATYHLRAAAGQRGDHLPSLFVRETGGQTRVDVLYLAPREVGNELHHTYWTDWGNSAPVEQVLARASYTLVPTSGSSAFGLPPGTSFRSTTVGWFGYDAVIDDGHLTVVYDEFTHDSVWFAELLMMQGMFGTGSIVSGGGISMPNYSNATPPPLAPGLTSPMPAPVATHAHQLKLLRLQ